MSAYANDPRVARLGNGDYHIADGNTGAWTVRGRGGKWAAFDGQGVFSHAIGWCDNADDAIAGVIGAPRPTLADMGSQELRDKFGESK